MFSRRHPKKGKMKRESPVSSKKISSFYLMRPEGLDCKKDLYYQVGNHWIYMGISVLLCWMFYTDYL